MQHKTPFGANNMPYIHMINNWHKVAGTQSAQRDKIYYILKKLSLAFSLMSRHCRHWNLIYYLLEYNLLTAHFMCLYLFHH